MKWEYKLEIYKERDYVDEMSENMTTKELNSQGEKGWELVSVVNNGSIWTKFYFKKEKNGKL